MQAPLRLRASLERAAASSATPMNIECQSSRDLFSIALIRSIACRSGSLGRTRPWQPRAHRRESGVVEQRRPVLTAGMARAPLRQAQAVQQARPPFAARRTALSSRRIEMPSPFRPATELMVEYAAYHRDRRNIATHFVGIPLIVFAIGIFLARAQFDV